MITVRDYLKVRKNSFIEASPDESASAKARLDSHRRKRRGRHPKRNSPINRFSKII
jgi:hypothetical protein